MEPLSISELEETLPEMDFEGLLGQLLMNGQEGALHARPHGVVELCRLLIKSELSCRLVIAVLQLVK